MRVSKRTARGKCHQQNKEVIATCISFSAYQTYSELILCSSLTEILPKKVCSFLLVLVVEV